LKSDKALKQMSENSLAEKDGLAFSAWLMTKEEVQDPLDDLMTGNHWRVAVQISAT